MSGFDIFTWIVLIVLPASAIVPPRRQPAARIGHGDRVTIGQQRGRLLALHSGLLAEGRNPSWPWALPQVRAKAQTTARCNGFDED
jgi:hypothetical protein